MLMFDLRDREFQQKLNSATKYPSIPTFHTMDSKNGMLSEPTIDFGNQPVQISEKIDGTNARINVLPGHWSWVIGSRENLLTCSENWIHNPELGIAAQLADVAAELYQYQYSQGIDKVRVYFFEVYGGRVGSNWKQYNKSGELFGHRLFDVIEFDDELFTKTMSHSREEISGWRERGNQPFVAWDEFLAISQEANLVRVPVIERRFASEDLPSTLSGTLRLLNELIPDGTAAKLEYEALGRAEGVVLKSHDRKVTAKLRFQDYENTLRRLAKLDQRKLREFE
jgi:hypothetical protein